MTVDQYIEELIDPTRTAIGVFGPIPSGAYYVTVPAPSPRRPVSSV